MIDRAEIAVTSGNGGDGASIFVKRKGKPFGPPAGGDGGKGADVYLVVSPHMATLAHFRHKKLYKAPDGKSGGANQRSGVTGEDLFIEVPRGTIVLNADTQEQMIDMAETHSTGSGQASEPVLLARGGEGGRGNMHMRRKAANARGQVPWEAWQQAQEGKPGESYRLLLELKLLADIGLVGLPNSGKSTLLSVLTSAKPKIADYPFTTLEPNLGVLYIGKHSYVIADIPGLIAGASEGKGLGKNFLRHIERTQVLVHLTQSYEDYTVIRKELEAHSPALIEKKEIVAISKVDTMEKDLLQKTKKEFLKHKITPLTLSAVTHEGLDQLLASIETHISR